MTREDRAHALCELKQTNPQRIVTLYCDATNTPDLGQLPQGIGFTGMIEVIIRHEVEVSEVESP